MLLYTGLPPFHQDQSADAFAFAKDLVLPETKKRAQHRVRVAEGKRGIGCVGGVEVPRSGKTRSQFLIINFCNAHPNWTVWSIWVYTKKTICYTSALKENVIFYHRYTREMPDLVYRIIHRHILLQKSYGSKKKKKWNEKAGAQDFFWLGRVWANGGGGGKDKHFLGHTWA